MADDERAVGAQVWATVRALSAGDVERVKRALRVGGAALELPTPSGERQRWAPHDLAHVLLRHWHALLKQHGEQREEKQQEEAAPEQEFKLQRDEFPQLGAPGTSTAKPVKRRITTTLLTTSQAAPVARPVPVQVAFPPLTASTPVKAQGGAGQSAWSKHSLLERRLGGAGSAGTRGWMESPGSPTRSLPSAQPTVPVKKKQLAGRSAWSTPLKTETRKFNAAEPQPEQSPVEKQSNQAHHAFATPPTMRSISTFKSPPPMEVISAKIKRSRRVASLMEEDSQDSCSSKLEFGDNKADEEPAVFAAAFQVNTRAAELCAFLIANRLVGSTSAELQVLVGMLFRSDCSRVTSSRKMSTESPETSVSTDGDHTISEFCWRNHCLGFAEIVLNGIEPILFDIGPELGRLIGSSLASAGICSSLREKLRQVAQRREERRVAESARIGFSLPVQTKASAVRDFALPFCEETDSRLHYRSPADALLYTNREKVRDSFLNLLRQFQKQQHSLTGIENANVASNAIEAARSLLAEVSPENRWWFAKFFVMELIQVGSNPLGESDKDLVLKIMEDKLVGKNPDRLRKLHRRFTSQKPSSSSPSTTPSSKPTPALKGGGNSGNGGGMMRQGKAPSNNNRWSQNQGKPSNAPNRNDRGQSDTNQSSASVVDSITAALSRVRNLLADSQLFFFHFLHSCDSYEFSRLVIHHLEWQFINMWTSRSLQRDPRKTFTEDVLKLKVAAKFLGYLRFSPLWHMSSSISARDEDNSAFTAAKREGISTLEVATSGMRSVDVKKLLEDSIVSNSIVKCIPWLSDFLCMLSLDKLSSATSYYQQLFVLLSHLYYSPRLKALGEVGLHVAFQIERIFQTLEIDLVEFGLQPDSQRADFLPPVSVRLALQSSGKAGPEDDGLSGDDALPFLYNQVFIQTCISELDDLRAFIQARSVPSLRLAGPRRAGSVGDMKGALTAHGTAARPHPIRKLRPLQVIIDKNAPRKNSFFEEGVNNQLDNDRREASPVKRPEKDSEKTSDTPSSSGDGEDHADDTHPDYDDVLTVAVFKSSPKLKSVVEFVVDAVATNVCNHVVETIVCPRADSFVDRNVEASGLASIDKAQIASEEAASARRRYRELMEKEMPQEIASTAGMALGEALALGNTRVRAAVPPLVPPSTHPTMIQSTVAIAVLRAHSALQTLTPKSSRTAFVKRVALRNKTILREPNATSSEPSPPIALAASLNEDSGNITRALASAFDDNVGDEDEAARQELLSCLRQTSAELSRLVRTSRKDWWVRQSSGVTRRVSAFTRALREFAELPAELASADKALIWDALYRMTSSCLQLLFLPMKKSSSPESSFSTIEATIGRVGKMLEAAVGLLHPFDEHRIRCFADLVTEWVLSVEPKEGGNLQIQVEWHAQLLRVLSGSLQRASSSLESSWRHGKIPEPNASDDTSLARFQRRIWAGVEATS